MRFNSHGVMRNTLSWIERKLRTLSAVAIIAMSVCTLSSCNDSEADRSMVPEVVADSEAININDASKEELQRIPYVGEKLAGSIVEHRERFGAFRRPEHLLLIQGVSDMRFRQIRHLIRVD